MVRSITLDMNALAASALLIWIGLAFAWVVAVGFAHKGDGRKNPPGELEVDAHRRRLPDDSGALVQQTPWRAPTRWASPPSRRFSRFW